MGWIGWTAEQALAMDVNCVELALAAKTDLLKTIYGSGEKPEDKPGGKPGKVTAGRFRAFIDRINGSLARG